LQPLGWLDRGPMDSPQAIWKFLGSGRTLGWNYSDLFVPGGCRVLALCSRMFGCDTLIARPIFTHEERLI